MSFVQVLWLFFFFSSRRRHTRCLSDWSSDVCSSDLLRRDPLWGDSYHQLSVKRARAGEGAFPGNATPPPPAPPSPPAIPPGPMPRRQPRPRLKAGARIRAKLDEIARKTRVKIDVLKQRRDDLVDEWVAAGTPGERRKVDQKIRTVNRRIARLQIKQYEAGLKAVYQRRPAEFTLDNQVTDRILSRNVVRGVEVFSRMVGAKTALDLSK